LSRRFGRIARRAENFGKKKKTHRGNKKLKKKKKKETNLRIFAIHGWKLHDPEDVTPYGQSSLLAAAAQKSEY